MLLTDSNASSDSFPPGRVVRLHFSCTAALPLGSSLRVTGSTLWAPSTQQDPSHAQQEASQDWIDSPTNNNAMHTSSVELYTTPDSYPLWKTRRPVVVVLHKSKQQTVQHHYYRYLVVTPGSLGRDEDDDNMDEDYDDNGSETQSDTAETSKICFNHHLLVATSNQHTGETSTVMMWEDPFGKYSGNNLCNLPYRTLDIHVGRAEPTVEVVDAWNDKDDVSFRPYLIREAVSPLMITLLSCNNVTHSPFLHFRFTKKTESSMDMSPRKLWVVRLPHPFQQPIRTQCSKADLELHQHLEMNSAFSLSAITFLPWY